MSIYWSAFPLISLSTYIFSLIAAKIAYRLSAGKIRKIFAMFLIILDVKMLL